LSAPRPSTPSCAPPPCVRFRPARAGSRLDHRRFNGPLFLLRSAVSRKRSASDTSQFRPARAQARWPCMPGRRDGNGGSSPGGRDRGPLDHRAHARTPDPEATIRPDGRGAMVVFAARYSVRDSVAPDDLDCGNQDPLGGTRTWNHGNPASCTGRLARSPGTIGWHAGTTHGREGLRPSAAILGSIRPGCPGGRDSRRNAHRQLRQAPRRTSPWARPSSCRTSASTRPGHSCSPALLSFGIPFP
jgi:hypothetical protein